MKTMISFVLLLCIVTAGFWPVPEAKDARMVILLEPNCHQYEKLPGCPRNLNPVCGTDGRTYSNECMLCSSNRTFPSITKVNMTEDSVHHDVYINVNENGHRIKQLNICCGHPTTEDCNIH